MAFAGGQRGLRPVTAAAVVFAVVVVFPATLAAQDPDQEAGVNAGLGTWAAPQAASGASPKGTKSVEMRNGNRFVPRTVTIDAGDRVRWRNEDDLDHTATGRNGSFNTGTLSENEDAAERFPDAGSFRYVCEFHPSMKGTVEVKAAGDSGAGGASGDPEAALPAPPEPVDSSTPGFVGASTRATDSSDPSGSLPSTGNEEIPLFALGAALLAAGLLAGAAAAWAEWAR